MTDPVELCGVVCILSACWVSSEHINYKKHLMIRSLYQFQVHYHIRQVLKKLQVPLPHDASFNAADNPYSNKVFFKLCKGYEVSLNPMSYRNEKFFGTHQHGSWSDYMVPDSMTHWIIEKSQDFTDMGLLGISESICVFGVKFTSFR